MRTGPRLRGKPRMSFKRAQTPLPAPPQPRRAATQGAAAGAGAQLLNDGIRRGQYQQAASQLSGLDASAARKALQADTYTTLSPIGKGLTDAAKAARAGQLAGKTAEELGESASRTSATWNSIGGVSKVAGAAGVVVGGGIAVSNISSAPEGQRGQVAAGEAGALGAAPLAVMAERGSAELSARLSNLAGGQQSEPLSAV
jgi:hypothetical protein